MAKEGLMVNKVPETELNLTEYLSYIQAQGNVRGGEREGREQIFMPMTMLAI